MYEYYFLANQVSVIQVHSKPSWYQPISYNNIIILFVFIEFVLFKNNITYNVIKINTWYLISTPI